MTERQGGTDLRTNITQAMAAGDHVEITGHKWFMSAPMRCLPGACPGPEWIQRRRLTCSDAALPARRQPERDPLQRLKDKLGNKSNASSRSNSTARMPSASAPRARGVRTIIEMVNLTRLDCAIASAGQSRIALSQALNHIRNRSVFQRRLADQPSMRATVADLALELEAQVALVFRLCRASERAATDPAEAAYVRLLTPAVKFLVCKSTPQLVYGRSNAWAATAPPRTCRWRALLPQIAAQRHLGRLGQRHGARRAARRRPPSRPGDGDRECALARQRRRRSTCVRLPTLGTVLRSGDAERRARFLCEGLAKIAALAALAGKIGFRHALWRRLGNTKFAQFSTADLGSARKQR
jgi:putative acyl-CoA dehydrogenase